MDVWLTKKEMLDCHQAAALRWQLARASGVVNQRKDKGRSDGDLDLLGIKAELAVSKLLSIKHNVFQLGVDAGADMFFDEISIDVKSTFHSNGRLLFKSHDAFRADCSVLVTATNQDDVMNVVGYASKKMFIAKSQTADLGHGLCYIMDQDLLNGMEKLWLYIQKLRHEKPKGAL